MPFCYCGYEGEKGLIKKSVQSGEGEYEDKRRKPQRCIKDACKERGRHAEERGAQQWWFQLCKGEHFVWMREERKNQVF